VPVNRIFQLLAIKRDSLPIPGHWVRRGRVLSGTDSEPNDWS